MKNISAMLVLAVCIVVLLSLSSCSDDAYFPLSNRCGERGVTIAASDDVKALFGNSAGQLAAGELCGTIAAANGGTWWIVHNAWLRTVSGVQRLDNCIVEQRGASVRLFCGTDRGEPASLIPAPDNSHWYSINAGVFANGNCELLLSLWERTGSGPYDFQHTATAVAEVDTATMSIKHITTLLSPSDILWGAALLHDGGYTYVYGSRNKGLTKELLVARVPSGSLTQQWEFFAEQVWSASAQQAHAVLDNIADRFSVFRVDEEYYLLSQTSLFGQEVLLYRGIPTSWQLYKPLYCRVSESRTTMALNTIVSRIRRENGALVCVYSVFDSNLQSSNVYAPESLHVLGWR